MRNMTTTESGSTAKIESRASARLARPWSSNHMRECISGRKKPNERRIVTDGGKPTSAFVARDYTANTGLQQTGASCDSCDWSLTIQELLTKVEGSTLRKRDPEYLKRKFSSLAEGHAYFNRGHTISTHLSVAEIRTALGQDDRAFSPKVVTDGGEVDIYGLPSPEEMDIDAIINTMADTGAVLRELFDFHTEGFTHEFAVVDDELIFRGSVPGIDMSGVGARQKIKTAQSLDEITLVWVPREDSSRFSEPDATDIATDGGQPRDFPTDGERIGEQWPTHPQDGHTRRDSRLKRHADWQAGVLVGLFSAAVIGLLWRLLR